MAQFGKFIGSMNWAATKDQPRTIDARKLPRCAYPGCRKAAIPETDHNHASPLCYDHLPSLYGLRRPGGEWLETRQMDKFEAGRLNQELRGDSEGRWWYVVESGARQLEKDGKS